MADPSSIRGVDAFCSWSGGKDSCLALHRAVKQDLRPRMLLTIMNETGARSRSHGLAMDVLQQQAAALNIPLVMRSASWNEYERVFMETLEWIKSNGIEYGVFGDIDLEDHLEWVRRVCGSVGVKPIQPLWKSDRRDLIDEFLRSGFRATIISVKDEVLGPEFLGRELTLDLADEFREAGIDPSGEEGEYHTVVTTGPLFSGSLELVNKGVVRRDGYSFLDFASRLK